MASMRERAKRIGKRVGCAGIVSAAVVTLGLSVHHGVQFTSRFVTKDDISYQRACLDWTETVFREIRAEVPEGATVYGRGPSYSLTIRLAELATPWAVPQPSPATAAWRLFYVPVQHVCTGEAVEARRT
jgi:hypothetical protein